MPYSDALVRWLAGGERGISSETIVQHLTGLKCLRRWEMDHPHDPDDLRRCRLLLAEVPELALRFHEMSTVSQEWAALVRNWAELCTLLDQEMAAGTGRAPRTYDRMQELIGPANRHRPIARSGAR